MDPELVESSRELFTCPNFPNGVLFSPDSSNLLTTSTPRLFHTVSLPGSVYRASHTEVENDMIPPLSDKVEGKSTLSQPLNSFRVSDDIYSYLWYPGASMMIPQSMCFFTTCRDTPIQLWDAQTGLIRGTYTGRHRNETVISAFSLTVDSYRNLLIGGYDNGIKGFDISVPGDPVWEMRANDQKGIISSLAAFGDALLVAGSYSGLTHLYDIRAQCTMGAFKVGNLGRSGSKDIHLTRTGVTQVKVHQDPSLSCPLVISGYRRSPSINVWDMRVLDRVLFQFTRVADTAQRIQFDTTFVNGNPVLATGSGDSLLLCNLKTGDIDLSMTGFPDTVNAVTTSNCGRFFAIATGEIKSPGISHLIADSSSSEDDLKDPSPTVGSLSVWRFF